MDSTFSISMLRTVPHAYVRRYESEQAIFELDWGFVLSGMVVEFGSERLIFVYERGDFFNEGCLVGRKDYLSLRAIGNATEVLFLPERSVRWLQTEFLDFNIRVLRALRKKVENCLERLRLLELPAQERVRKVRNRFDVSQLTQAQIARLASTSRETVSRTGR